jgi:L-ascorbate metabolism protein UlaG (beta-lactamase superfamily)
MEVTKYIHSCLLVKTDGKTILIDPGEFTYSSKTLNINTIDTLDYLLITHEHADHMHLPFIKEILERFPNVKILTNSSVKNLLAKEGINSEIESTEFINIETVPHEKVFGIEVPKNVKFRIGNELTHPGDSFHFSSSTRILALPLQAPWGTLTEAVELAESLKPEVILPIHDWHWNDQARESFYKRLVIYFEDKGIRFIPLKTGEPITI